MKIICNKCYANEITIHNYDGILYADPCVCIQEDQEYKTEIHESEAEIKRSLSYDIRWDDGYLYGMK